MGQMSTATSKLKKAKFLEHYAESGNVSQTCRALEISRNTIKYWLRRDKKFHAAYEQAQVVAVESLEEEAWKRAKAHSDLLLIFLLKGMKPDRYRDNSRVTLTGENGGPIRSVVSFYLPKNGRDEQPTR